MSARLRLFLLAWLALLLAAAIWLPCVYFFFRPRLQDYFILESATQKSSRESLESRVSSAARQRIGPKTGALLQRHLRMWTDPQLMKIEIQKMRGTNAEWDFMGRSFLVWALSNLALRDPENKAAYLEVTDRIIAETLRLEQERGQLYFLMAYARSGNFAHQPNRSLFVDGEIALMLAMRRVADEKPEYRAPMRERLDIIVGRMKQGRVMCAESYPSECWTFCNTVALAAIRAGDYLDGSDHSEFFRAWLQTAKDKLTHKQTGLLVSSFDPNGNHLDGPEGSSIWMAAHCLDVIDPAFARDQYERARKELGVELLGFAYAREWPRSWANRRDVDSGPVIPLLGASAGSSGQAFIPAAMYGDGEFLAKLLTSLEFAAFPVRKGGELKFCASNQVGDAVLLYAAVAGPIWNKIKNPERGDVETRR